jgi:hypothetical protein
MATIIGRTVTADITELNCQTLEHTTASVTGRIIKGVGSDCYHIRTPDGQLVCVAASRITNWGANENDTV